MGDLTHVDPQGKACMVDVSSKAQTVRFARAAARVFTTREVIARIREGGVAKGPVLDTARIAGIQAAKKTSELIPMCHPLLLDHLDVSCKLLDKAVSIEASARTFARTGVEMEAITAATVAALTVYDMCKAMDRAMVLSRVRLLEKSGGRSGYYQNPGAPRIAFVAPSGTGKTTYLEGLIRELTARGYRVGTIKHDAHDFDIDHEGKDSYRLRAAGSARVVIAGNGRVGAHGVLPADSTLPDLVPLLGEVDIVLVEGYRDAGIPVVLLTRAAAPSPPHPPPDTTVAVVGDADVPGDWPRMPLDDPVPMIEFLEEQCRLRPPQRSREA